MQTGYWQSCCVTPVTFLLQGCKTMLYPFFACGKWSRRHRQINRSFWGLFLLVCFFFYFVGRHDSSFEKHHAVQPEDADGQWWICREEHNAKETMLWESFRASLFFCTCTVTLLLSILVKHSFNNPLLHKQFLIFAFCKYTVT